VVRDLDEAAIAIDDIGLRRPTLDDVFLSLTGHAAEQRQEAEDTAAAAVLDARRTT
jgi:ABC-2 type transport system ATP-binding protein